MDIEVLTDLRKLEGRTIKSISYTNTHSDEGQIWKIRTHDKKLFFFRPILKEYPDYDPFLEIEFFKP